MCCRTRTPSSPESRRPAADRHAHRGAAPPTRYRPSGRRSSRRPCGIGSASPKDAWAGSDCSCLIVLGLIVLGSLAMPDRTPGGWASAALRASPPARRLRATLIFRMRSGMGVVIAIIAQGSMGAGVGKRLHESGAEVRTLLSGRSEASAERARAAGMKAMPGERELLDGADFFLSVLPPGEAESLARRLAPALTALQKKPVYVDCNAISPQTAERVAAIVAPTGAKFVDGGIIGGPPRPGYSPAIYASGPAVGETAVLRDWGLDWRAIDGPIGAASGLKMSYAGITKGITALGSSMMLGAAHFGCAEALLAELSSSQPAIFKYLSASIPRMYDKAYRWVAEMEKISAFHGSYKPAADIYAAIARHYEALAAAEAETAPGPDNAIKTLDRVLGR